MKYYNKIRTNKLLITMVGLTIISFIIGLLFIALLDKTNQELVIKSITSFFINIIQDNVIYSKALNTSLINNLLVNTIIWVLGISIIGVPIVSVILFIKTFIVGFSFSSIVYTFHMKGIITGLVYIFPHILNIFVTFIMTYYSISFSILLYKYLFKKKDYNRLVITKRYLKLLLLSTVFLIVTSFIEVFVIPFIFQIL